MIHPLTLFGTMTQVFHVLFMACFPLAVILAIGGQWVAAVAVFFIGTPVFWILRNRSAVSDTIGDLTPSQGLAAFPESAETPLVEDGFLPEDHPMVEAWAEAGERFLHPVDVVDWRQYLATINARDRASAVQDAKRGLVLTTNRILVVWLDGSGYGDIRLSSIVKARTMKPPGKPVGGGWELALEVEAEEEGRALIGVWSMHRNQANWLLRKLEEFRRIEPGP